MALDAAREIVEADGLRGLSTRRIAKAIGYSAGTLYQLFEDLDDLIVHLNAETLDGLYEACRNINFTGGPEAELQELAARYIRFVGQHPRLWNALLEHQLPNGRALPPWYHERTERLLDLANAALLPFIAGDDCRPPMHDARVLWASLYGIASLASWGKLAKGETSAALARSLAKNYVAGLRELQGLRTSNV